MFFMYLLCNPPPMSSIRLNCLINCSSTAVRPQRVIHGWQQPSPSSSLPFNQRGRPGCCLAGARHQQPPRLPAQSPLPHGTEIALDDRSRAYLFRAREEANRIAQIARSAINNLREAASLKEANVPDLLRSVLDFYQSRLQAKDIAVNTRYCLHENLPVYAGSLRQAFSNLLLNAVDAMPHGGTIYARVSRGREWTGQQRRGLRVTFADNGCGVTAANLPRIMEPFFTTKGSEGNGIGLSLVMDTVLKHNGLLHVRSSTRLGHSGTIFAIFLPAAWQD
jgi:signal transduction histidine kinase